MDSPSFKHFNCSRYKNIFQILYIKRCHCIQEYYIKELFDMKEILTVFDLINIICHWTTFSIVIALRRRPIFIIRLPRCFCKTLTSILNSKNRSTPIPGGFKTFHNGILPSQIVAIQETTVSFSVIESPLRISSIIFRELIFPASFVSVWCICIQLEYEFRFI